MLIASEVKAQDYEIWATLKVGVKLNDKWRIEAEGEDRYNLDAGNIRYFHHELGFLYLINDKFRVGLFYRDIYENKNDIITRVLAPHADVIYNNSGFKFRTRLEYIVKYEDYENKFRLRIRPGYQTSFWKNFNPFIQDEIFLTDVDELAKNRLNIGISIKLWKFVFQPGYLLETSHKDLWTNRNILWINTKIKL